MNTVGFYYACGKSLSQVIELLHEETAMFPGHRDLQDRCEKLIKIAEYIDANCVNASYYSPY